MSNERVRMTIEFEIDKSTLDEKGLSVNEVLNNITFEYNHDEIDGFEISTNVPGCDNTLNLFLTNGKVVSKEIVEEYITEEKLQAIMKDALEAKGYEVTEEKLEEIWGIYEDCQEWNVIGEMTTGFSYDAVVDFVKHSSSVDEVFNEAFNTEFEKANEHYKLVTGKYMDAEFAEAHADKLILCYQKAIDYINIDFWAVYEDLLDENLTYREYVYIDSHNIFNPFEVNPSDIDRIQEFRKDLDAFREKYKDAIDSLCENLNKAEDCEFEREVEAFVPVFETDKHVCIYYYENNNEWYAVDKETGDYKLILDDSYVWINEPSLNIFVEDTLIHIADRDLMFNLTDTSKYLLSSIKDKVPSDEEMKGINVLEKALTKYKSKDNLSLNDKINSASGRASKPEATFENIEREK